MTGFYLMHRGWQDNPAFNNEPFSRRDAWVWLIETANYADGTWNAKGKTIPLKRGQLCRSYRDMATAWKWDEAKVRRFFGRLQSDEMIRCVADAGVTVVTICNYDIYQPNGRVGDASTDAGATQKRRGGDASTDAGATQKRRGGDAHKKEGKQGKEGKEEGGEVAPVADAPSAPPDQPTADLFAAADEPSPPSKVVNLPKGSRLSPDWVLPAAWEGWAADKGASPEVIAREAEKFRDHWLAKAGADARKADWYATWRTWMRRTLENPNFGERHGSHRQANQRNNGPRGWAAAAHTLHQSRH